MGVRKYSRQDIRAMEVLIVDFPEDLAKDISEVFDTHLPIPGGVQDKRENWRKSSVRFIQSPPKLNLKNSRDHRLRRLDAWIQQYNPHDYEIYAEIIQVTTYEEGEFYKEHRDASGPDHYRKLSLTVQLNDPSEYEGGEFVIKDFGEVKLKKGQACVFDPTLLHEVRPVTKGTRYSIVSWFLECS